MPAWNPRANEIFLAAMDIEDLSERRSHLDAACGDDAELRRQVEALLAAHQEAGSFLQASPATADFPAEAQTIPPRAVVEASGAQIGPYKLLELIGEGGMGAVWLAEQREPVRRRVALKVIKAGMDSAQVIARFEAERQALALMDHPNIAKVLDAGQSPPVATGGLARPYFVMELVKGTPITSYCDQHRLTPAERLQLFVQVCQAVQHAHQKGIIHRDLKPSNVLVAPFDGRPVVKVIDFGVAKAVGQQLTERTMFTGFGAMIGTLQYMSPEQAELNNQDIDTRSDIYSLGVMLYELLTGSTPLDMNRLRGAAMAAMLMAVHDEEPPKPSTRLSDSNDSLPSIAAQRHMEPAKLTKLVRGDLDWIVMKALSKDRSRRYETANGLAADINRYLGGEPVTAHPPSAAYRMRKFVQKNKSLVLAVTLIMLALVSGVAGTTWQWSQAAEARSSAELDRDEAQAARKLATSRADAEARARAQADAAREQAETSLYFYRVNLAREYWLTGNAGKAEQLLDECPTVRRGWEWHYLRRLNHDELRRWPGTAGGLSHDGKLALLVQDQDELVLLETARWTERRRFRIPNWSAAAFSPDATLLLVASRGFWANRIQGFDVLSGEERFRIDQFRSRSTVITEIGLSPDNRLLVTASGQPNTVQGGMRASETIVWEIATRKPLHTLAGTGITKSLSPDGRWLAVYADQAAASGSDGTGIIATSLRVLDLNTAVQRWEAANREGLPDRGIIFSPDGRYVASARGHSVLLFDSETGKEVRRYNGHTNRVTSLAFNADSQRLLSGGLDQTVRLWNVMDGKLLVTYRGFAGESEAVGFTVDSKAFLSSCSDGVLRLRAIGDPEHRNWPQIDDKRREDWLTAALSGDGNLFATLRYRSPGYIVELTDVKADKPLRTLGKPLYPSRISADDYLLAFAPDGRLVAGGDLDGTVRIWNTADGTERQLFKAHDGKLSALRISPDGVRLLTAGWDGSRQHIVLWNVATGREELRTTIKDRVSHAVFSADSSQVALGGAGPPRDSLTQPGDVTVLDTRTGGVLWRLSGHTLPVDGVGFSSDGQRLATASRDKTVRLWDLNSGRTIHTLRGHTNYVVAIAFSPDGKRIVTASFDDTLKIWDATSGQEILTLPRRPGNVIELRFDNSGRRLFGIGWSGIQVWDATPTEG